MLIFIGLRFIIFVTCLSVLCECDTLSDLGQVLSSNECMSPNGVKGICRNIRQCKTLLELLVKNKYTPDTPAINFLRRSHCGFEGIHPIVCCPIEDKSKGKLDYNDSKAEKPTSNATTKTYNECGTIRQLNKIIGGSETMLYEFPWMTLIGYRTKYGFQYRCGGTLISSRYVLTAAHCVSSLHEIFPTSVRLGEYNLSTEKDCRSKFDCAPPPIDVPIEKIIPHPNYYKPELRNDIALIKLAKNVENRESIQTICLPLNNSITERSLLSDRAVVTGWGTTETGIKSQVLLKTTLPIVPPSECTFVYRKKIPITESQICAGGEEGKDSCSGDSGGPLQVIGLNAEGQPAYIQEGIVSFGPKNCGTEGKPGVYTKVAHYTHWILQNIKE